MKEVLAWVILVFFLSLSFIRTFRFRRGETRTYVDRYRDRDKPAVLRNSPLLQPFVTPIVLAYLFGAAAAYFVGWPGSNPTVADAVVYIVLFLGLFVALGFAPMVLIQPPDWLVPKWLAEEDKQIGWVAPPLRLFDQVAVGFGLVSSAIAALAIIYTLGSIAGR